MENLGDKIREERRKRKLTLIQLSEKTKLSVSFLSQVERGITNPSVSSLKKIAREFGISVVNFFMDETNHQNSFGTPPIINPNNASGPGYVKDVKVVRAGRRKSLSLPGSNVSYDLLTPDLNRRLEVMYMRIAPGEESGDEPVIDPPGEKFCLVLKGTLEMKVGEETHHLEAGDTIYFPAHFPQAWHGLGKEPIEVVWVLTPPWF